MLCPDCGYEMTALETHCPRCVSRPVMHKPLTAEPLPVRRPTLKNELYLCRRCGAANAPTDQTCGECGETLGYDKLGDAFRDPGVRRVALESTVTLSVLLCGLHVFTHLSDIVQAAVIVSAVIVLAWRFLRALEGHRG